MMHCSFCKRSSREVPFLVATEDAAICGACIAVTVDAMSHRADGYVPGTLRPCAVYRFVIEEPASPAPASPMEPPR